MDEDYLNAATRLAQLFSEEADIPTRLRKKKAKPSKKAAPSKAIEINKIEQRFQAKVKSWQKFIETLNSKISKPQSKRFIDLRPIVEEGLSSAAYCQDFLDFTDYFILRRDKENCDNEELGQLAQIYTEFQKRVERMIAAA